MNFRIQQAVAVIAGGGIVAYPTEAVWGLGCDPWNEEAVQRLLQLKVRSRDKGLILVGSSQAQFAGLFEGLTQAQRSRLDLSWPGPTTWLVPHLDLVPAWISGNHSTVALRVSAHPVVARLCEAWGGPLVSTSANVTGSQEAREQFQVWRYFGEGLDGLVPGRLGGERRPSMIRDLQSDRILRPG